MDIRNMASRSAVTALLITLAVLAALVLGLLKTPQEAVKVTGLMAKSVSIIAMAAVLLTATGLALAWCTAGSRRKELEEDARKRAPAYLLGVLIAMAAAVLAFQIS